jgi:hypothetical protein
MCPTKGLICSKPQPDFEKKLLSIVNSCAKSQTSKKVLHASVQNFLSLSEQFGSTVHYAVTITFPADPSFL